MLINTASFIVSLMLSLAVYAGGLQLSLDKSQQGPYCGVLQCLADEGNLPHNVLSVISLTIYDITRSNIPLKLASVSAFTPGVVVEASKINVVNATGSVSKNQAGLILGLLGDADCLYASYQCELDFVNNIGQSDVLRESITPADDNATILHILSEMAAQLKTQTEVLNRALQEFSRIERFLNASCVPPDTSGSEVDKTHVSCFRGMASTNPREKINLWNVTVSLCDTKTDGGGWIVIQRRTKGDVNFFRSWNDYKKGFGTPDTDFWIGNDIIHNLTSQGYNELRIEFQQDDDSYFGQYSNFSLASEQVKYRISISGISGSVYDYMMDNNGASFGTYDNHDQYNCPSRLQSGWWFPASCGSTNLNGVWGATGDTGLTWGTYKSLSRSEMKVRRA